MNNFFDDPIHPSRPRHRDFWRLVKAVNKADAYSSEDEMEFEQILREKVNVDSESLVYMARQRALRAGLSHLADAKLMALYIDAFCAGVFYERD